MLTMEEHLMAMGDEIAENCIKFQRVVEEVD